MCSEIFNLKALVDAFPREFPKESRRVFVVTHAYGSVRKAFADFLSRTEDAETYQGLVRIWHKYARDLENGFERRHPFVVSDGDDYLTGQVKVMLPEDTQTEAAHHLPYPLAEASGFDLDEVHGYARTALAHTAARQLFSYRHEEGHSLTFGTDLLINPYEKDSDADRIYRVHLSECVAETYAAIRYAQSDVYDPAFMNWTVLMRGINQTYRPEAGYVFYDCFRAVETRHRQGTLRGLSPAQSLDLAILIAKENAHPPAELKVLASAFHNAGAKIGHAGYAVSLQRFAGHMGSAAIYCSDAMARSGDPLVVRHGAFLLSLLSELMPAHAEYQCDIREARVQTSKRIDWDDYVRPFALN